MGPKVTLASSCGVKKGAATERVNKVGDIQRRRHVHTGTALGVLCGVLVSMREGKVHVLTCKKHS